MAYIDFCERCPFVWTSKCKPYSQECNQHKSRIMEEAMKSRAENDEYCRRMRYLSSLSNKEQAHKQADDLLCEVLDKLGFPELVFLYKTCK